MTKLAKTRVRARKGDQSWSLAMSEDRQARRVMICTVSTLRPAYRTRCRGARLGTSRSQNVDDKVGENACPGSQGRSELVIGHV